MITVCAGHLIGVLLVTNLTEFSRSGPAGLWGRDALVAHVP